MGTRIRWIHLQGPWDSVWKLRSSGSPWCDSACPQRGKVSSRGPGAKHLANIMSQRDLHTPCGHTTETERLQATTSPLVSPGPTTPHQAAWRRDEAAGSTLAQKRVIGSCWVCPNLCDRTPSRRQHQSKQGMRLERGKWQESRSQHHAGAAACCQAQRLLQGLSRIW